MTSSTPDPVLVTALTYEAHADRYAERRADRSHVQPTIARFAALLPPGASVLDAGCGPGVDTRALELAGLRPIALDLAASMLNLAVREVPGVCLQGDLRALPLADAGVDSVWAMASLLHLPKAEVSTSLSEVLRVLRPAGLFFSSLQRGEGEQVESRPAPDIAMPRWFARYSLDEWQILVEGAGFRVIEAFETDHWVTVFARRP